MIIIVESIKLNAYYYYFNLGSIKKYKTSLQLSNNLILKNHSN